MRFCTVFIFSFFWMQSLLAQILTTEQYEGHDLCRTGRWEIVLQDDFEGASLDTNKWITYYPYGPNGSDHCYFCRTHDTTVSNQVYLDRNVVVDSGILRLMMYREPVEWMGFHADYSSSLVHSKRAFNDYFKYEIRCQIPSGRGFWPAFWVFGWSTEIDVFEFGGHRPWLPFMSVHKWGENGSRFQTKKWRGKDYSKEFHVFAAEYEPNFVTFLIDGKEVHRISRYVNKRGKPVKGCNPRPGTYYLNPIFPQHGDVVNVIAGNAISSTSGFTGPPDQNTVFPNAMLVDYIRVYVRVKDDLSVD